MDNIKKIISIFTPRERRNGLIVLVFAMASAMFEVLGVASILPFLNVLANPEAIHDKKFLALIYDYFDFSSSYVFLQFLGFATFIVLLFSAVVRTASYYLLTRFVQMRRHAIGSRLLEAYLRAPYVFFLKKHSGEVSKTILSEIEFVIGSVLQPAIMIIANCFTLLAMLIFLLIVDPWVVLTLGSVIGGMYVILYRYLARYVGELGKQRATLNQIRFNSISEALGGIKEIKLMGRERSMLQRFLPSSYKTSANLTMGAVLAEIPRYAIEALAFGGILALSLILMIRYGGHDSDTLDKVIPLMGVYAFAGYKMLPLIQAIYRCLSAYQFGSAAVEQVYQDCQMLNTLPPLQDANDKPLPLRSVIAFDNISYRYPGSETDSISNVSFTLRRGSLNGIVGPTAAGKSTLMDIFLGLLEPTAGSVRVDDTTLTTNNIRAWQNNIGFVPQDIFLIDSSIRENIAFGIPEAGIDDEKVKKAAQLAQIDGFISSDLPDGYLTAVGERGVRLSGGQKQRIGIARALYHDPDVIMLDEATSALDNVTEKMVMQAIQSLSGQKTVVLIAHRLSTVRHCDQVLVMHKGRLCGAGTYDELVESNEIFQDLHHNQQ